MSLAFFMHKAIAGCCLVLSAFAASPSLALPFKTTPGGFTNYLNSLSWEDGKRRVFSGLSGCNAEGWDPPRYGCRNAYVTISDPVRGKIFCEIETVWSDWSVMYGSDLRVGSAYPCRRK